MKGVKPMEDIILKMNLLGGMNAYVENLGDDDATDYWLTFGIPDGATEEDLVELRKTRTHGCRCVVYLVNLLKNGVKNPIFFVHFYY